MTHSLNPARRSALKSRVPNRSERFVRRPRLNLLLDEATTRPLTIVSGPAGVGKTLAVADWTRDGNPPGPVVWITVEEEDRRSERLWESVLSALTTQLGEEALGSVEVTHSDGAAMVAAIAEGVGGTLVLVLDGCERLSGGNSLSGIDELLANPLPELRLVMLSRHDPPLALHRLRLADQLREVRFRDLAFTRDEACALLERCNVSLPERALARLLEATEGWAAALRLAAFSLSHAEDPEQLVENLDGINFLVSDYLWDEVLGRLPAEICEFLQFTSVSDRLCGQFARELSGNVASHQILRTLAAEELLVQELDGSDWYRTHPLLSGALRRRVREERPEIELEAHRRAAHWFEDHGDPIPAIQHAAGTQDWEFAGMLAVRCAASVIFSTDHKALADALADAPPPFTHDWGELAVAQALAYSIISQNAASEAILERAVTLLPSIPGARRPLSTVALTVVQAFHAHHGGNASLARTATTEADDLLSGISTAEAGSWAAARPRVSLMRVGAALWAGDPSTACELSNRLSAGQPAWHPASFSPTYHLGLLAFMEAVQERNVAEATTMARHALDLSTPRGRVRSTDSQFAWLALGLTALLRGEFLAARTSLAEASRAAIVNPNPNVAAMIPLVLSRLEVAGGDLPAARRQLAVVDGLLTRYPGMVLIGRLARAAHVEVELSCGAPNRARSILDAECSGNAPSLDLLRLSEARVLLAQGNPRDARNAVGPLLKRSGALAAEAWLVVSRAEDSLRHDSLSMDAFAHALEVAADHQMVYPFLRHQPWLTSFLNRHLQVRGTHRDFALRILTLGPQSATQAVDQVTTDAGSLTERELAVLAHLPTMSSNTEIASALSISVKTVKQHLKSSYRKLGVGTRRDAVRVARDRGLLPQ